MFMFQCIWIPTQFTFGTMVTSFLSLFHMIEVVFTGVVSFLTLQSLHRHSSLKSAAVITTNAAVLAIIKLVSDPI